MTLSEWKRERSFYFLFTSDSGSLAVVSSQVVLRSLELMSCLTPFSLVKWKKKEKKVTSDFKKHLVLLFLKVKELARIDGVGVEDYGLWGTFLFTAASSFLYSTCLMVTSSVRLALKMLRFTHFTNKSTCPSLHAGYLIPSSKNTLVW